MCATPLKTSSQTAPIAIIGIGCRLPGGATSPEKLWELLSNGRSGHCEVPHWRYNAEAFYHPESKRPGSINSTGGYFIQDDIRKFENSFFGINNLEAAEMDPQQRKLLEVAFECFESSGTTLKALAGSDVGCYVANFALDFPIMQLSDPEYITRYAAVGGAPNILANRISHVFDLRGPSLVLDTACSSSLYALHCACVALEAGDCTSALVASANLIQSPQQQMLATKAGIISNSSTCRTFDAAADGYGRSEGVGAIYLKPLSAAIEDGDPIRAIIRGTSANSNGHTNGIMLPSADGQEQVIRKAYSKAGLPLDQTDFVEAHGTGTAVGDPIEVEAIAKCFKHYSGRPTVIGSVKTNLGHSEANSGISSVLKVVLALEHRLIPPTIGIQNINPQISEAALNVDIARAVRPWPETHCPRASVNSFGFGGANSHVILESSRSHTMALNQTNGLRPTVSNRMMILPVSAQTQYSLTHRLFDLTSGRSLDVGSCSLASIAYTLANRRSLFNHRGYLIVDEARWFKNVTPCQTHLSDLPISTARPDITFIFTGQGAQWTHMGKELYQSYHTFRAVIDELDDITASVEEFSLRRIGEILSDDAGSVEVDIDSPDVSQVFCTAVQIALVDLLKDWKVTPSTVIGHSSGEIAAAYAAGMISKRKAILTAFYRGYIVTLLKSRSEAGAMLACGLDRSDAECRISQLNLSTSVVVACVNSPYNVTLSGDVEGIDRLKAKFDSDGIFNRKLKTNGTAYHSAHMSGPVGIGYEQKLSTLFSDGSDQNLVDDASNACIEMISTVDGNILTKERANQASYWRANLESPVLFQDAIESVCRKKMCHFIEIGPHPALRMSISQTREAVKNDWSSQGELYSCTLIRNKSSIVSMLELAGSLFVSGKELDFDQVNNIKLNEKLVCPSLPGYNWCYTDNVMVREPRVIRELRTKKHRRHELLGSRILGGSGVTMTWRNRVTINDVPWLQDHRFGPSILFPAAGFISMIIEAMRQIHNYDMLDMRRLTLRHLKFSKALAVSDSGGSTEVFTELRRLSNSISSKSSRWWHFRIDSLIDDSAETVNHVTGTVCFDQATLSRVPNVPWDQLEQQSTRNWFNKLKDVGLNWGPSFKVIEEIFVSRHKEHNIAATRLLLHRPIQGDNPMAYPEYIVHPTVIDSMLQTSFLAASTGQLSNVRARIPVTIEEVNLGNVYLMDLSHRDLWTAESQAAETGRGTIVADAELYNAHDEVLIKIKGARAIVYQGTEDMDLAPNRVPTLRICWKPDIDFMFANKSNGLEEYLRNFIDKHGPVKPQSVKELLGGGCLDLIAHKTPRLRYLTLGQSDSASDFFLAVLGQTNSYPRLEAFQRGYLKKVGLTEASLVELVGNDRDDLAGRLGGVIESENYDYILADMTSPGTQQLSLTHLLEKFPPSTGFIITLTDTDACCLENIKREYVRATLSNCTVLVIAPNVKSPAEHCEFFLVGKDPAHQLNVALQNQCIESTVSCIKFLTFDELTEQTIPSRSNIIFTGEYESGMLDGLSPEQLLKVQHMTNCASNLLWVTQGNITQGQKPEAMLAFGMSRAIMMEQPSLKVSCFDFDLVSTLATTVTNIRHAFQSLCSHERPDNELAQVDNVVEISRWVPDEYLNSEFQKMTKQQHEELSLDSVGPCQLLIEKAGQLDTIKFEPCSDLDDSILPNRAVEVEAKCYGMNAKDYYLLNAKFDVRDQSCSCEFSGVVKRIGPDVNALAVGDRVIVMAPGGYRNLQIVPEWACAKLLPSEDFESTSAIGLAFATAIYALKYKANLQCGETVLIHSASGGVGNAAIQIARSLGANVFVTAGTPEKRQMLHETFSIPQEHIFSSRDSSFLSAVLEITNGNGVDVVLNSLTGDLLRDSLRVCAPFGRFIELGKKDILENGRLDMACFARNLTFTAFDLMDIYYSDNEQHKRLWQRLLNETLQLLRAGTIQAPFPLTVFDVSHITQAFRFFARPTRMGKVVVSMQDGSSMVKVVPPKYKTHFDSRKTYIMIGGFGGVGRSLSRWMLSRGARSFVFLSRSGAGSPSARHLLDDLEARGANARVVIGDVSVEADVESTMSAAPNPIGGVVQASMSVRATHWESISHEDWTHSISAKVKGCWNLHHSLTDARGSSLDFFLLVSSVSGTVGSATEAGYCAANAFMDNFARFRRSQGLPAVSLGLGVISEIGYLHEHPEMEAIFIRRGMQAINEDEMLRLIDLAVSVPNVPDRARGEELMDAHILTGLELTVARSQILESGGSDLEGLLQDPRAGLLAAALARNVGENGARRLGNDPTSRTARTKLPPEVRDAIAGGASFETAICTMLASKFAGIVMSSVEKLDLTEPLVSFGLDSMLAAEFRAYVFQNMGVDLPFMKLLSQNASIKSIADQVVQATKEQET